MNRLDRGIVVTRIHKMFSCPASTTYLEILREKWYYPVHNGLPIFLHVPSVLASTIAEYFSVLSTQKDTMDFFTNYDEAKQVTHLASST